MGGRGRRDAELSMKISKKRKNERGGFVGMAGGVEADIKKNMCLISQSLRSLPSLTEALSHIINRYVLGGTTRRCSIRGVHGLLILNPSNSIQKENNPMQAISFHL